MLGRMTGLQGRESNPLGLPPSLPCGEYFLCVRARVRACAYVPTYARAPLRKFVLVCVFMYVCMYIGAPLRMLRSLRIQKYVCPSSWRVCMLLLCIHTKVTCFPWQSRKHVRMHLSSSVSPFRRVRVCSCVCMCECMCACLCDTRASIAFWLVLFLPHWLEPRAFPLSVASNSLFLAC